MRCSCRSDGHVFVIELSAMSAGEVRLVESRVRDKLRYVHDGGHAQLFTPVRGETEESVNMNAHAAEYAWCKYRGVAWSPLFVPGRFRLLPDAADGGQVRQTRYTSGHLILHPPGRGKGEDDPADRFDLVTGTVPRFIWRGWLLARDGQHQRYWREEGPGVPFAAYFVPQGELHGWPYHDPGHVHEYARDATGSWTCVSCGERET